MAEKWNAFGAQVREGQTYHKQNFALAVVIGTPIISLAFTLLRFYAKRKTGWGADDVTISLATFISFILIYPSFHYIKMWHFGIHIWDVNPRYIEAPMRDNYVVQVWFNVSNAFILPLVKASILLLLLRVGGVINNVRKFVWVVFVFNALSCLFIAGFYVFQCPMRSGNKWHLTTFGGARCLGRLATGRLNIAQVCISMFTDLLIFPIPCYLTWKLQKASFRNRMIVVALFGLSLAVTAIGAAKIYYTYKDRLFVSAPDDWTWDIIYTINHWENCVSIVVACIPSLRVLILRWLGKEEGDTRATGASPIRITGGNTAAAGSMTHKSARESFLSKLKPPSRKRGLYDTTIGDQTIDLESCAVKTRFDETIIEEETASCSSKGEIHFYSRSESVSTTNMNDDITRPEKART